MNSAISVCPQTISAGEDERDMRHAQKFAHLAQVLCTVLNKVADAVGGLSYEEVKDAWGTMA